MNFKLTKEQEFVRKVYEKTRPVELKEATKTQCCCNCAHDIREEDAKGNIETICEIDGHHISYLACFEQKCDHWKLDPWQRKSKKKQKGE